MERWAPLALASERDNSGLQIGSGQQRVTKILVTLDLNSNVIDEAHQKKADLIISHHPLLFHALRSVNPDEHIGSIVTSCVKYGIAIYSAHTNLDFTQNGVSTTLALKLGLSRIEPLMKNQRVSKKIVVFVPHDYIDRVRHAMMEAGAGTIGNYTDCSFAAHGIGTFKPTPNATPFIGTIGKLERVNEARLEMLSPSWKLEAVIAAMKRAHPYEEIAYDIYNRVNTEADYGVGAIGTLSHPMKPRQFLTHVADTLRIPSLRYSGNPQQMISVVAVCGGSGSDLLSTAAQHGADAFVTADISYHRFMEKHHSILFIDAGHYETEVPVVPIICKYLKQNLTDSTIEVIKSKTMKNNVQYFIP